MPKHRGFNFAKEVR